MRRSCMLFVMYADQAGAKVHLGLCCGHISCTPFLMRVLLCTSVRPAMKSIVALAFCKLLFPGYLCIPRGTYHHCSC